MYIKLLGADASAKNLGQISVEAMDTTTLDILSHWTRFSEYSPEAYYLNELIVKLKDAGLWNKIHLFYLPWMAVDVDELLYNPQGVVLGYSDKDNLYSQGGVIFGKKENTWAMRHSSITMPSYDIKGKFLALANAGTSNSLSATNIFNSVGSSPLYTNDNFISFGQSNAIFTSTTVNTANKFGQAVVSTDLLAGVFIFANDFTYPNSDNYSKARVSLSGDAFQDSVISGTIPSNTYSTYFDRLGIGAFAIKDAENYDLTSENRACFVLGNTTLSESDGLVLKKALVTFETNLKNLRNE